jgi:hypothetical protein
LQTEIHVFVIAEKKIIQWVDKNCSLMAGGQFCVSFLPKRTLRFSYEYISVSASPRDTLIDVPPVIVFDGFAFPMTPND